MPSSLRLSSSRRDRILRFVCLLVFLLAAPRSTLFAQTMSLQPAGWSDGTALPDAPDLNPDPKIVEVNLEARVADVDIGRGIHVQAWTYNGGLPGPLIHARAGDRVIVHFVNHLPAPTTVHWHGVRVPIEMDGVPGISQPDVKPGESFTYDFVVPDAGLFWYHPHVMSAAQVGFGLTGALLVDDPADPVNVADQLVIVLSDVELRDDGSLESPNTGGSGGMAFGREGNHVLVNGRHDRTITVRGGAPERWRIVNTTKSRYFSLQFEKFRFRVIGVDGGLTASEVEVDDLVMAPGERKDVIVTPKGKPGDELVFRSLLYDRGYGSIEARHPFEDLIAVKIADGAPYTGPAPAPVTRVIEPLSAAGATDIALDLSIAQLTNGDFEYRINGKPFAGDKPIPAQLGETQVWTLTNRTKWSHPFHLHGFFFQVLDDKGAPVAPLAWKDTVDVPYEQTRKIIVRFDERPGQWMVHCHILDHAEGGLMTTVALGVAAADHKHAHEGHEGHETQGDDETQSR